MGTTSWTKGTDCNGTCYRNQATGYKVSSAGPNWQLIAPAGYALGPNHTAPESAMQAGDRLAERLRA